MPPQQRPSATSDALTKLREAEEKVIKALREASASMRALSSVDPARSSRPFHAHAEAFHKHLKDAQTLLRDRIQAVGADLPLENQTMFRLIEADLAAQRTAHVHRSLAQTLALLGEAPIADAAAPAPAPSPQYAPSPSASTPLNSLVGIAASPPTAGAPITLAVPSPADAASVPTPLTAQVALNGAQQAVDAAATHDDHTANASDVAPMDSAEHNQAF